MVFPPVIQRAQSEAATVSSLPVVDDGMHSPIRVPQKVLDELNKIVLAAQRAGGGASINPTQAMADIAKYENAFSQQLASQKKKIDSQETYGVGASQYFPGTMTLVTVGSNAYGSSLKNEATKDYKNTSATHLGVRDSCVHGEIEIITQYPGIQAVHTTQDCCLFCYGVLASRGYQHQGLRKNPWPQAWTHDYLGFKIAIISQEQYRKNDAVVTITFNGQTRCYRVE